MRKFVCQRHGASEPTSICRHLGSAVGAGFFRSENFETHARPDAWCSRCEEVFVAESGWNDTSEAFARFRASCSGCYDEIRQRNEWSKPEATQQSFTCGSCGEVHVGLPPGFALERPSISSDLLANAKFTDDACEIEGSQFIRACLEIPIVGGSGPLVYGVWVSLSDASYAEFVAHRSSTRRFLDGPYFGWFVSTLEHWPDTTELKTHVHIRPLGLRPVIELEPTDHPLAVAQRDGITLERYRELAHLHRS